MGAVLAGYFVLLIVYSELVHLAPDTAPDKLGAGNSNLHMLFFALLVGVLAPFAEEFLFRGFLYRALRNGIGIAGGAIVSGLFFGALHIDAATGERLLQVVPLAVLGILLALLYEKTGTLYASIGVHATNNSIAVLAYASEHKSNFGVALAIVVWLAMMVACAVLPRFTDRKPPRQLDYDFRQ
jgi:membrane protease YdiL (CAAX protease family)